MTLFFFSQLDTEATLFGTQQLCVDLSALVKPIYGLCVIHPMACFMIPVCFHSSALKLNPPEAASAWSWQLRQTNSWLLHTPVGKFFCLVTLLQISGVRSQSHQPGQT